MICLAALAACAPRPAPAPPKVLLDCRRGFAALSESLSRAPDLRPSTAPGEPYVYYNAQDGQTSYLVTRPGAPGHPAVIRQAVTADGRTQTGCPFGDPAGYAQLDAYLRTLARGR